MNADQLKNNIGQVLRLWPFPVLIRGSLSEVSVLTSGAPRFKKDVVDTDYDWQLENVTNEGVSLHCLYTGHKITLGADNVREYRSPNFLMLKCRLILDKDEVRLEPL